MGPEVAIFVAMVITSQITIYTDAKPQKAFAKGYSGRNLPSGKWTRWFDASSPGMTGEYETVENVIREYGRGCDGLLCRHPLAVKAISVYGLTPSEHRDKVHLHGRTGLICRHQEQLDSKCMDYKVRFYCPFSHMDCPDHTSRAESRVNELNDELKQTKLEKFHAKENAHKQPNEAINYFKSEDKIIVEMPEYVKYIHNSPKVILPHIRGKLAQMPDYNDAMTSHLKDDTEPDVMLSYLRDEAPSDTMTSHYDDQKAVMEDSAPSVNDRGQRYRTDRFDPPRENSITYRHFRNYPRAPFG